MIFEIYQNVASWQQQLKFTFSLLSIVTLCSTTIKAEKIAVFYHSDYIQIAPGSVYAEGSNLLLSLEALGHEVMTIENIDAESFTNVLSQTDLLVIPELERENLFANLSNAAKAVLKQYIAGGGGMIICGVVAPNEANSANAIQLLNGVYDLNLKADAIALSGNSDKNSAATANTYFDTCEAILDNNNSIAFLTGGYPNGTKLLYQDRLNENNTTAALIPYQNGEIAYLGWGWWNAAPTGTQDNGWLGILDAAVKEVACTAPVLTINDNITVHLNEQTSITITPEMIDYGSYVCNAETNISITPNQFNCDHVGIQEVEVQLTDALGRVVTTTATITVEDILGLCIAGTAAITGRVVTQYGEAVEGVMLEILGANKAPEITGEDGLYTFADLDKHQEYEIIPHKDEDYTNGISTYDLLLISRHILEIERLESPYSILAGDANRSGTLTTADIVELRKLILFQQTQLSSSTAWRFVPKWYQFENPTNPLVESLPEISTIPFLEDDMILDFIAIKVGDVNGSAILNNFADSNERSSANPLTLSMKDELLQEGVSHTLNIQVEEANTIEGMQLSFEFDPTLIENVRIQSPYLNTQQLGVCVEETGKIHLSWYEVDGLTFDEQAVVFELNFDVLSNATASDAIRLSNRFVAKEAYIQNDTEVKDIELIISAVVATTSIALISTTTAFEVYQNYPNPFVTNTTIPFELKEAGEVSIVVQDLAGRTIYQRTADYAQGKNSINLTAADIPTNGTLIYTVHTEGQSISKQMIKVAQ